MRTLLSLLALTILTTSAHAGKAKIAVLTLEGDTAGLSEAMRDRAKAAKGPYELAPGSAVDQATAKQDHQCASERPQCMAAIGADLGADKLLYGRIETTADSYVVSIKLLDVARKRVIVFLHHPITKNSDLRAWAKQVFDDVTRM